MILDWIRFGEPLTVGMICYRLMTAVLVGALIGVDREEKNRPAGLRTHMLVCIGAALIALVEQETVAYVSTLGSSQINVSAGRITSGIVTGVGFLGAGTIVLSGGRIQGLTTAASLWCTACLGLTIGMGFTTMALLAGVMVVVVLKFMQKYIHIHTYKMLEVQYVNRAETIDFLNQYFEKMNVVISDMDFHVEVKKNGEKIYTNLYSLRMEDHSGYTDMIGELSEHQNIRVVRTRNL